MLKNTSNLMYSHSFAAKELVETVVDSDTSCTNTETESSNKAAVEAERVPQDTTNLHTLFTASAALRNVMKN